MNNTANILSEFIFPLVIGVLTLCLTACSATKIEIDKNKNPDNTNTITKTIPDTQPQRIPKKFSSIRIAIDSNKEQNAKRLLLDLPLSSMSDAERVFYETLSAEIAWREGDLSAMDDHLALLQDEGALNLFLKRFSGEPKTLIKLAFKALKKSPGNTERIALRKILWFTLLRLNPLELSKTISAAEDREFRAWLHLAKLIKSTHPLDLREKLSKLSALSFEFPTLKPLPGGLNAFLEKSSEDESHFALLLPLSGRLAPAARAIQDGFLEAYFRVSNQYERSTVHMIDSTKYDDITEAYFTATGLGVDYVIGPLEKKHVATLKKLDSLPIPILALNRSRDESFQNHLDLIQLSLSPVDEVLQISNIAFARGFRKSLIISPKDSWGEKMSDAVTMRWSALGGEILGKVKLGDPSSYSDSLEKSLHLQQSHARAIRINEIIDNPLNFELRRRQDLDVIFLLADSAEQARAVAPLLKYHFAGDLPVYATSKIYYGVRDERNRDLDGITLVDMPELLNSPHLMRSDKEIIGNSNSLRLHALGSDAFILQYFIQILKNEDEAVLLGHSGLITMRDNSQVVREAIPAEFVGGSLVKK